MKDFIKFLGTAGARFVVSKQLRSSAGIWCCFNGLNILIDPGPGTLSGCHSGSPALDPSGLDAILLSHRHLDHSTDLNVMTEAMTNGTYTRRGAVYLPENAVKHEPVLFKYLQESVKELVIFKEGGSYGIDGKIRFSTPVKHIHPAENYGFVFELPYGSISFITDTAYTGELADKYRADILVINVVLYEKIPFKEIQHLDLESAQSIINTVKPSVAILTHFGMTMLKNNPDRAAEQLTQTTGIKVIAASDGLTVYPESYIDK